MDNAILTEALTEARLLLESLDTDLQTAATALDGIRSKYHVTLRFVWAALHLLAGPGELTPEDIAWAREAAKRIGLQKLPVL